MDWLTGIVETHKELESPAAFWKWAALSAISAVIKDNVWWDKFEYKLYPNIYVMLHAESGLRKGPPIAMAKRLVKAVNNTTIISGRSSIQGILKRMGTVKTAPGGKIVTASNVFICSSELTSSIVDDPVATTILTDLFDRHYNAGEWESLLKMESFSLKNPTVTMLAGTNEAHAEEFFAKKDVQGGYFARTFIVYETKRQTVNSLMFPLKNPPDDNIASEYLKKIAHLKGEFNVPLEVRTYFDEWYKDFTEARSKQDVQDKTGTLNRFDDSVLKVAMLIALGKRLELRIELKDVQEAIKECEKLIGNVRKTTMAAGGKGDWYHQKVLLLKLLIEREGHQVSRTYLNKTYYLHANSDEWDRIAKSLEDGGQLKAMSIGSEIVYKMPDDIADQWKKHLEGK